MNLSVWTVGSFTPGLESLFQSLVKTPSLKPQFLSSAKWFKNRLHCVKFALHAVMKLTYCKHSTHIFLPFCQRIRDKNNMTFYTDDPEITHITQ